MTIDRLLIICSLIELSFIAVCDGLDCFSFFQWFAVGLLCIKGLLVFAEHRRTAFCTCPRDADAAARDFPVDTDGAD